MNQAREVLGCLRFDPGRHVVLSLMAAVSTEELAEFTGLPTGSVCRAIPLPSVARHDGATLGEHAYTYGVHTVVNCLKLPCSSNGPDIHPNEAGASRV